MTDIDQYRGLDMTSNSIASTLRRRRLAPSFGVIHRLLTGLTYTKVAPSKLCLCIRLPLGLVCVQSGKKQAR